MTSNTPKNHHFVPKHFLREWKAPSGKICRYRVIEHVGKNEIKEVGIDNIASQEDLYLQKYPDRDVEIETSVMRDLLDTPGSIVLNRARNSLVNEWSYDAKQELVVYLVCLEARHPEIMQVMDVKPHTEEIRSDLKIAGGSSDKTVDEVVDMYDELDSTSVHMLEAFISNEKGSGFVHPLSSSLINGFFREYTFDSPCLVTSNYPAGRSGYHGKDMFFPIAISPTKALVYSDRANSIETTDKLYRNKTLFKLINFYTVSKARDAFYFDDKQGDFIFEHLGWANKVKEGDEYKAYLECFLKTEIVCNSGPSPIYSKGAKNASNRSPINGVWSSIKQFMSN